MIELTIEYFSFLLQARHSAPPVPIYITVDPDSPAYVVYHDHSYFIRHESNNSSNGNPPKSQSQIPEKSSLPSVQVLNQLLLEHQQKTKNSQSNSPSTPIDFTAILRALLVKQGHHLPSALTTDHPTPSTPSSTAAL